MVSVTRTASVLLQILAPLTLVAAFFLPFTSASAGPLYFKVVPVAGPNSNAYGINANGDVTGVYQTGGEDRAFIFTQADGFLDLGTLDGGYSIGRAINDGRHVIGQSDGKAFRWTLGTGIVELDSAPSNAFDINGLGIVVGSHDIGGENRMMTWESNNSPTQYFSTLDAEGYGTNLSGSIVGRSDSGTVGFYSDGGDILAPTTNLSDFLPNKINNSNIIAGSIFGEASIFTTGTDTLTGIGKLNPTDLYSDALGINGSGFVVGISEGTGAFGWNLSEGIFDLNDRLAPGFESWSLISANGVNDNGWITGQGINPFDGELTAVNIIPVPEPAGVVLLVSGLTALGCTRKMRRNSGLPAR